MDSKKKAQHQRQLELQRIRRRKAREGVMNRQHLGGQLREIFYKKKASTSSGKAHKDHASKDIPAKENSNAHSSLNSFVEEECLPPKNELGKHV